jgi:hypothetical protein
VIHHHRYAKEILDIESSNNSGILAATECLDVVFSVYRHQQPLPYFSWYAGTSPKGPFLQYRNSLEPSSRFVKGSGNGRKFRELQSDEGRTNKAMAFVANIL